VAGGDDLEKVLANGETPSGRLPLGPAYLILEKKEEAA